MDWVGDVGRREKCGGSVEARLGTVVEEESTSLTSPVESRSKRMDARSASSTRCPSSAVLASLFPSINYSAPCHSDALDHDSSLILRGR